MRERFACRACETISQPPAPFHGTPRGLFGASLLAMILFEKFGQHQPLNRQRDRYAHFAKNSKDIRCGLRPPGHNMPASDLACQAL